MKPEKKRPTRTPKGGGSPKPSAAPRPDTPAHWRRWGWPLGLVALGAAGIFLMQEFPGPAQKLVSSPASTHSPSPTDLVAKAVSTNLAGTNIPAIQQAGEGAEADTMSESEKAVALLTQGNELLAQGKLSEALKAYRASLAHDPGSEDTHYNLAIALARAGEVEEAIQHYQEALRILPDYAEVHNNFGNLLVKQGKVESGIEHFYEAIKINPEYSSAYNNLGTALGRQGRSSEAILQFSRALELMPEYLDARYNLGVAYLALNRIEEAAQQFQELLQRDPNFEPARAGLLKIAKRKAGAK